MKNYSGAATRNNKHLRGVAAQSLNVRTGLTKKDISNLLEDMKSCILHSLAMQSNNLEIDKKQEEAEKALAVFYPKCTKKHAHHECPTG